MAHALTAHVAVTLPTGARRLHTVHLTSPCQSQIRDLAEGLSIVPLVAQIDDEAGGIAVPNWTFTLPSVSVDGWAAVGLVEVPAEVAEAVLRVRGLIEAFGPNTEVFLDLA